MTDVGAIVDRFIEHSDLDVEDLTEASSAELRRAAEAFFDPEDPSSADPGITQQRLDVIRRGAAEKQAERLSQEFTTNFGTSGVDQLNVRDDEGQFTGKTVDRSNLRRRRVDFGSYVGEQLYDADTGRIITQRKVG